MNRMKPWFVLVLVVLLAAFGSAACQRTTDEGVEAARENEAPNTGMETDTDREMLSDAEKDFARESQKSHMMEVDLARLAMEKSRNDEVRDYAEMLVDDHGAALERITEFMEERKVQHVGDKSEAKKDVQMMSKLSGAAFDREFMQMMVENHTKAVEKFRNMSNTAQNAELKEYASDLLPKIEHHLEEAKKLAANIKG